jgi:hypothetical protein
MGCQALLDDVEGAREIIIQVDSFARLGHEIHKDESWSAADRPAYQGAMAAVTA